jgi:hypothetical protein
MFAFFGKSTRNKSVRRAPRRFRLESLESRNCPSAMPLTLTLGAQTGSGNNVDVGVNVQGGTPGYQVSLSGPINASLAVDSSGVANYIGPATELGTITGTVTDSDGDTAQETCDIQDQPPQITSLSIIATGQGKQVDVSGTVSSQTSESLSVNLSGSAGLAVSSTTTDDYGNFNLVTTATSLGDISAVATDIWGVASSPMSATLMVQAPQISNLNAINLGNGEWEIQGSIMGPDVADDSVQLSGVAPGSGSPDGSGSFSIIVQAGSYPTGTEYAVATDIWGQTSNQASYTFST